MLAVALVGCAGPREAPESRTREARELTAAELRELLAKGTIQPVTAMEGEDAFRDFPADMDDEPAARRLEQIAKEGRPPAEEKPPQPARGDPQAGATGPGEAAEPQAPAPRPAGPRPNPYLEFGQRIKVYPDGTITKPYPLRAGTGEKMLQLMRDYGNFPLWTPEMGEGPSSPGTVKIENLPGWDVELYQDLRAPVTGTANPVPLADWLVVTTGPELLYEVEDFINLFAAGVPQIEIEAKIVEITFVDTLDLGVRTPAGVSMFDFPDGTFIKSLTSSTPNQTDLTEALLAIGGVQDGLAFNAILEAIATRDNVSIISRPKIAVREGGKADISNTIRIPFLKVGNITPTGGYAASVDYQEVGVKLFVVPRVVGTQTVALNIDVEASQQSGSEPLLVSASGDTVVSVPTLSLRTAHTVVYLQPGQAVILGGLITERNVDAVRKVPILGDIPLLNLIFRSKFTRKEQTNVLFFIRPRILQGIDLNREF